MQGEIGEMWEAMRRSGLAFALIDPVTHAFVDVNSEYASLFRRDASEMKGLSLYELYGPDIQRTLGTFHESFVRGTLEVVRGSGRLTLADGSSVHLKGWTRRIHPSSGEPLVVTAAAEAESETMPDDGRWINHFPRLFRSLGQTGTPNDHVTQRLNYLEQHLWRIGLEVQAAGLLPSPAAGLRPQLTQKYEGLSPRQREIVARLLAGERVGEIARDLYLSPSTVRNHLTAVFRRFGVHSQLELLSRLRHDASTDE